ncbi:hypothetical protein C2845_PM03G28720 [Panicum miliaceum]|uniref:TF-B3 domain-containing protein n=1 Tax=Panicum miliaceum TaxID=4540 RepID=A0A3L6TBB5_PANMI|nr:hypothetical protein C2845_PM03G28720 [Panicum miliaceum]
MDDDLSVVVAHQPVAIPCGDTDDDDNDEVIPIKESDVDARQIHASVDDNWESAMSRAQEIEANLPVGHPSFAKRMLQSHVVRGFWLGLPKDFSQKHLPKKQAGIVLEDEHGEDHHTTYLYYKQGLSAGWRGFAVDHDIKVGDVVVFELVKPTKFKAKEESSEDVITDEDAKCQHVNLILDCLATDCGFHGHLRRTYYELCCSQRSLLHKNLLRQLHPTLAAGVILETVSVAEGIRACKAQSSSREDFLNWKKTLESFELLGMNVAFLLKRVNDLLATRSRESSAWQEKYKELKLERACAGEKMKVLELQLSNVKDALQKVDAEMEELESSLKKSDEALQELASAPW